MLVSKKRLTLIENEKKALEEKFIQIFSESKEKESFFDLFLHKFNDELKNTVAQHEIVNSQHHGMGDLVNK